MFPRVSGYKRGSNIIEGDIMRIRVTVCYLLILQYIDILFFGQAGQWYDDLGGGSALLE
jgi:hypothetical protein